MIKALLIFLLPAIMFGQTASGVIKGRVVDADNGKPLVGTNVTLLNTKLGVAADIDGYYEIKNIPFGKYVVNYSLVGYPNQKDTVVLTENENVIEKNIFLRFLRIPIVMPDSLKEYHNLFKSLVPDEILTITVDSISHDYEFLHVTFTNKTEYPIYVLDDLRCFNTISVVLKNGQGEVLRYNIVDLGCDEIGVNYLPQKGNLKKLDPFDTIKASPVEIIRYSIKGYKLSAGNYFVSVIYEIEDYQYLPGVFTNTDIDYYTKYKDEIEVLSQATRGKYYSDNDIVIEK